MQFQLYSLQFDSVQAAYAGTPLHDPVSFTLKPGEWIAMVGPSGCGKTTLLRAGLGFSEAYTGQILVNDTPLDVPAARQLRQTSGYLPQRPYIGEGPVPEILAELCSEGIQHQLRDRLFPRLGLPGRVFRTSAERLSGGELQRIGLALLASRKPAIFFLDEPSSGLDTASRSRTVEILQESGACGIVTSHDQVFLDMLGCRIIQLDPTDKDSREVHE